MDLQDDRQEKMIQMVRANEDERASCLVTLADGLPHQPGEPDEAQCRQQAVRRAAEEATDPGTAEVALEKGSGGALCHPHPVRSMVPGLCSSRGG